MFEPNHNTNINNLGIWIQILILKKQIITKTMGDVIIRNMRGKL